MNGLLVSEALALPPPLPPPLICITLVALYRHQILLYLPVAKDRSANPTEEPFLLPSFKYGNLFSLSILHLSVSELVVSINK